MPLVLLLAENDQGNLSSKRRIPVGIRIVEYDAYRMRMIVVLVNEKERPLTIRTMYSIRRNQNMSLGGARVTSSIVQKVFGVFRLGPLLGQQLSRKELRSLVPDLISLVDHEHMVRTPTVGADRVRRRVRQGVVIVRGLSACGKKARKRVRQPQRTEDIDRGFPAVCIGFGIKHRNAWRQAVIPPDLHDVSD